MLHFATLQQVATRPRLSNKGARSLLACAVAALRMFLEEHSLRPCPPHGARSALPASRTHATGPLTLIVTRTPTPTPTMTLSLTITLPLP